MKIALVTGSAGLVGAEAVRFFSSKGFMVVGIDNDMRQTLFGPEASTDWSRRELEERIRDYRHHSIDIRDRPGVERIFAELGTDIRVVIHTAAQPSHDWASRDPHVDFAINATGTLNLLESTRRYCPDAVFIFTSTNKVYGDHPNRLPFVELPTRWEVAPEHPYAANGVDETMPVDQAQHSLYGVSKLAADALVQEYARSFGMKTVCFRCGCITGPGHAGTKLHGFLSYLVQCAVTGRPYTIIGYGGKQVRDNLHAADLVGMFWEYYQAPRPGELYNAGGGRHSNCSVMEAIALCEDLIGQKVPVSYDPEPRTGDHRWYISDGSKFRRHYPAWASCYDLRSIVDEIAELGGAFGKDRSIART